MGYITIPNTFTPSSLSNGANMTANFTAITDGLSDGTKDINVNAGTFSGLLTCSANLLQSGSSLEKTSAPVENTIYPNNQVKAWAKLTCGAAGAVTVTDGFNVDTAEYDAERLDIFYHTDLSGTFTFSYKTNVITASSPENKHVWLFGAGSSGINFYLIDETLTPTAANWSSGDVFHIAIIGEQ